MVAFWLLGDGFVARQLLWLLRYGFVAMGNWHGC
jgi:hypothetical protein